MENKKKKGLLVAVIILSICVIGLGSYLGYDKFIKKNNSECNKGLESFKENDYELSEKDVDALEKLLYNEGGILPPRDNLGFKIYFEKFLNDILYVSKDNTYISYKVKDLDDDYFSIFIWRKAGIDTTITNAEVKSLLKKYFNKENYEVKELDKNKSLYGLEKTSDGYITSVLPTDSFDFPLAHVNGLKYDSTKKEIKVYYDFYSTNMVIGKEGSAIATLKYKEDLSENYFYLDELEVVK